MVEGDGFPAAYLLLLFVLEQYRLLEVQEAYILEAEEGRLGPCGLSQFVSNPEGGVDTGYDCSICQMESIGAGEWVYSLKCKHQFHRWCLVEWLVGAEKKGCPLCRDVILTDGVYFPGL